MKIKKYFKVWWILTVGTTQIAFASRFGAVIFVIGKMLRFLFFLLFLIIIIAKTQVLASYTFWQVIFFYATYTFLDSLPQFFLREVYRFRYQVINGYFDNTLAKPFSPLFKTLFGGADLLDIPMLLASLLFIVIAAYHIGPISFSHTALYVFLLFNAFLIALAFHVCVLSLGLLTTEVDNMIMLYRDFTQMGRFPVDIYKEPIKGLITFIIPVGIMMTFPSYALLGILSLKNALIAFFIGMIVLVLSLLLWRFARRRYSSASS